ncbi:class I SAM-dependent methyltransferase [Opitutales bacterium ASA1]|jgi:SAM-dependent methyltransferase|uniref:class I SAM-dependent methyltransferase n=1 Tax=Congregicoccus parvus TaxID=3081749 RepID=UPI002B2C5382|nr:class I SAM-dependent methyltransferase [Opitutales bacterium ASA1]
MDAAFWDNRYAGDAFVYGTEPNAFLIEQAHRIPAGGRVLCMAEGEGRNAVHLAALGHEVTALDQSGVALAKARRFAASRGVTVSTLVADLAVYDFAPTGWAAIVAIWAHLPHGLRRVVHGRCVDALAPGGVVLLEAYTPDQLRYDTGGPRNLDALMTLAALREEFAGLEFEVGREIERDVREGSGHTGRSAVVQVAARKPLR